MENSPFPDFCFSHFKPKIHWPSRTQTEHVNFLVTHESWILKGTEPLLVISTLYFTCPLTLLSHTPLLLVFFSPHCFFSTQSIELLTSATTWSAATVRKMYCVCWHRQVERGFKAVHVSGVELQHMGQQTLGHYPVHFHMNGDVDERGGYDPPTSVVDLSIHHSFSRCVTIHASNGLLVG